MATNKPKRGAEGPKRSVAKPTAAQSSAAKKKAAVKKSSSEGPKRSISKPTPLQTMRAKGPSKVVESGVGNLPMTVARGAIALGKAITKQTPSARQAAAKARTEAMNARTAQQKKMMAAEQKMKDSQRTTYGSNASYSQTREGIKAQTRATKEYSAEKARYEAMVKAYKGKKK
jgi:hypothetical protein